MADQGHMTREGSTASATGRLDKVAAQRAAAAAAHLALTDDAQAIERLRSEHRADLEAGRVTMDELLGKTPEVLAEEEVEAHEGAGLSGIGIDLAEDDEPETEADASPFYGTLQDKLEAAVSQDGGEPEPDVTAVGHTLFQWVIVPSDEEDNPTGSTLVFHVQVDEQAPGAVTFELTPEMLDEWLAGEGLQGNRVLHKKFVAAMVERVIELSAFETGNALIYALEQLMAERLGAVAAEATENDSGLSEPDLPEMTD